MLLLHFRFMFFLAEVRWEIYEFSLLAISRWLDEGWAYELESFLTNLRAFTATFIYKLLFPSKVFLLTTKPTKTSSCSRWDLSWCWGWVEEENRIAKIIHLESQQKRILLNKHIQRGLGQDRKPLVFGILTRVSMY